MRKPATQMTAGTAPQKLRGIGYVRVSTDQQAQEGVSMDAQQVRIRAHCVSQDIELVDIVIDDGYSAKSLDRPGMRRALGMLEAKQADAIVVVKLDRLTRSVKDLGYLCDTYFREGMPYSLLSVCDSIDTRSAGGKLLLNVLMSVAQWEREAISERTQEAMDELKRRGVKLGGASYGWQYTKEPDAHGRRNLIKHRGEQATIGRICAMHLAGLSVLDIARKLIADGVPPRNAEWERPTIYRLLERQGLMTLPRRAKPAEGAESKRGKRQLTREKPIAIARAHALRSEGLSLRKIAERLQKEHILPARADIWHAAGVLDLLRQPLPATVDSKS